MTYPQPDVSLIVPCYNQSRFLPGIIESVKQIRNLLIEIIIIDDGSPSDDALKHLKHLEPTMSARPFVLRRTLNCGLSASRNLGLRLARGRYIKFLDADDLILPGSLETQVGELDSDEIADFHLIGYCTANEDLSSFNIPAPSTLPSRDLTPSYVAAAWETDLSIPIHTALFRASSLNGLSFSEELEAKEDWLFWHAVAQREMKFLFNPRIGVVYRTHATSMTRNQSRMASFWLKAIESIVLSGTQLNSEEQFNLLRHFNGFYLPALNHSFFAGAQENSINTASVRVPLLLETKNDLN
jgi:glycosyltransferase involved in cell wall biosynthesis